MAKPPLEWGLNLNGNFIFNFIHHRGSKQYKNTWRKYTIENKINREPLLTLFFPALPVHHSDTTGTETIVFSWLKMDKSTHILSQASNIFWEQCAKIQFWMGLQLLIPKFLNSPPPSLKSSASPLVPRIPGHYSVYKTQLLVVSWYCRPLLSCLSRTDYLSHSTLCLKKVPTFKLSVTLSHLNWFSKFLHCWKAYEISQGSVATCLRWGG